MTPPSSIAHYRITTKLGEGGMGAVYRATDTKLNREVAVKVLPDTFAADPDRLARFAREAQVLASLKMISQLGVVLYMFIIGLELNTRKVGRYAKEAIIISHASIVIPFVLGTGLALWL